MCDFPEYLSIIVSNFFRFVLGAPNVHSHLAVEALAGLAAKEDFSHVQLKQGNTQVPNADFVPYKKGEKMLLQVKGRRPCQIRLVKPEAKSMNSGDAYILLSGDRSNPEIYVWYGKFINAIERSRAADVAQAIITSKDLGCKATKVAVIEEEAKFTGRKFWKVLGYDQAQEVDKAGPPEEDDEYVQEVNELNLVWTVNAAKCELEPLESAWGAVPKYELLGGDETRVLVFDFGTEVYVWNGRSAPFESRRIGLKLAKDYFESKAKNREFLSKHLLFSSETEARPKWTILGKVNQNMETILFKEKFVNWPQDKDKVKKATELRQKVDSSIVIKPKSPTSSSSAAGGQLSTEVVVDAVEIAEEMSKNVQDDPNLELEGSFLGRGVSYYDETERRQYEIETLDLKVWHVSSDEGLAELKDGEKGRFSSEDTYVVRWKYKVSLTGRDLKGRPSKHVAVGRERFAYYFWQGSQSGVNEKGASALMTVELDRERGPQIRVDQGKEHAAFLNLWKGSMMIHQGRHSTNVSLFKQSSSNEVRLYVLRGECANESCLVEVKAKPSSLRSRGVFFALDYKTKKAFKWIGSQAPEHKLAMGQTVAEETLKEFAVSTEEEGSESSGFKARFEQDFVVSKTQSKPSKASVRMYQMSSLMGAFKVTEVLSPSRKVDVPNLLPCNQDDLYDAEQPSESFFFVLTFLFYVIYFDIILTCPCF